MKPDVKSLGLLRVTRSKAKMYEYAVPVEEHIEISSRPADLLVLTIGILGDLTAESNGSGGDEGPSEESLRFAARYFDAFRQSRLAGSLDTYLLVLGAAAYYLCGLPGSAKVLIDEVDLDDLDLEANGLEALLSWVLQGELISPPVARRGRYEDSIQAIGRTLVEYASGGGETSLLFYLVEQLRIYAYGVGSARDLLFSDIVSAVIRRRCENSSWRCLPLYSGLEEGIWADVLRNPKFIREFWPAQRLIGEQGVLKGSSAVIQMPTSAGKSRAIEIIVRAAFLGGRASLAIVVAPFRALCHEIRDNLAEAFRGELVSVNELTDVFRMDLDVDEISSGYGVVVVTPEKLAYVLRHAPELALKVGLIFFDEGHQFDADVRGVTYELLLTSLKKMLPGDVQMVMISAVISNAESIGGWLGGERLKVISGRDLLPTERTIAFASWQDRLGRLEFVEPRAPDRQQFFVPRVIEELQLQLNPRERAVRYFPKKSSGTSIALYLGVRLSAQGSVAVFCGTKSVALAMCDLVADVFGRKVPMTAPAVHSDGAEVRLLGDLFSRNLGEDATVTASARVGVFSHHGSIPHGVRLAVEYAMKMNLAKVVICTSTLAQGVNLPIRYLIVSGVWQGAEKVTARDFHNLIGRVGRSGMHTEGSVIFSNPEIYDLRKSWNGRRQWSEVKDLLRFESAAPCASSLLKMVLPLEGDQSGIQLDLDPYSIAESYVEGAPVGAAWAFKMASTYTEIGFSISVLERQFLERWAGFAAVESFLMAHLEDGEPDELDARLLSTVEDTLAFYLADDAERDRLVEVCALLARNVQEKVGAPARRPVFSRMMYGVDEAVSVDLWVVGNVEKMESVVGEFSLLSIVWPLMVDRFRNHIFHRFEPGQFLFYVASLWIDGYSFGEIFSVVDFARARFVHGQGGRAVRVEHLVELCEGCMGFEGALALGAVAESLGMVRPDLQGLGMSLRTLQARMKYGLPGGASVFVYELGLADRELAQEVAGCIGECFSREATLWALAQNHVAVREVLSRYPSYFVGVFEGIVQRRQ
ncbi:DEAD/DEAH box helicase [Corallococcus exiguus]|uniref:DEAD/DEAH box helicase n=1 Tax=Corallococcus exiguus TaxID=83462 RepID=UPI001471BBE8|nr:DEAD/DEAH box helicase [Corallococcus exiguus]NNB94282.1 DEAD/DEAH box helicase [Corallococcus exiguus]NNC02921.1 DEAD/DEAH box helicase [Corallococcus exiguus]